MKRHVMGGAVALLLTGHAAFAAVQYEYFQTSRSDVQDERSAELTARAVIDGTRSRVEFIAGNTYPPGTYVISTDGARKLLFVDPTQKTYTEVNSLAIASAVGTSNITIDTLLSTVTKLDDAKVIAGIPADHYRLTMTYNITVNFRNMLLRQAVRTTIDKWTTVRFGDVVDAAFSNSIQTGNAKVDELIEAETTKIKGFPLKQTIQIVSINESGPQPVGSKLKLPSSRTQSREMTVTAISEAKTDDSMFRIPAEYRKIDFTDQINKSQTQVLSTQPSSQ